MYLGNQPALSYTSFAKQDFTTSATTSYTLDNPVANANELALFINFVRQEPTTAYSANSTTLTLTEATSVGDDMYCVYLGKAVQTVNPPNASVGASQIVDASITSGKLASGVLPTNTPSFEARLSSDQTISDDTFVKINVNEEVFDTDNCYDNSTNYRFTPTVAGKYYVYWSCSGIASSNNSINSNVFIYFNGSQYNGASIAGNGVMSGGSSTAIATIDFNGSSDYVEFYLKVDASSGSVRADHNFSGGNTTFAGAYKLIG